METKENRLKYCLYSHGAVHGWLDTDDQKELADNLAYYIAVETIKGRIPSSEFVDEFRKLAELSHNNFLKWVHS